MKTKQKKVKAAVAEALKPTEAAPAVLLKLDLGCGKNKQPGHLGVDSRPFDGVDVVLNLVQRYAEGGFKRWPWKDNSVEVIHCSHFVEHLKPDERIHFANECYRVLIPGGKALIITPNWSSCRAYGDLTHEWPPVCEFWYNYLNQEWRGVNAPHNDDYTCDFDHQGGWSLHPHLLNRNVEYQQHALSFWKEAGQDLITTITSRKKA